MPSPCTSPATGDYFAGKYADTFEGFLRRHKGQEEVEFHVKRVEGEICFWSSVVILSEKLNQLDPHILKSDESDDFKS